MHRWTATELAQRWVRQGRQGEVTAAHRRAAEYWRWRVAVWPQDRRADVHDLLEARHHLLEAGDVELAAQLTEGVCSQLETWGAWDDEVGLIHDTLTRLPATSNRRAAWIHQLGILAQHHGDYAEADRRYRRALEIKEEFGDRVGMSTSDGQLGVLAQDRGDYAEADRQYHRALEILEGLGDRAGTALTLSQLGVLLTERGDVEDAVGYNVRSLALRLAIGSPNGQIYSTGCAGSGSCDTGKPNLT